MTMPSPIHSHPMSEPDIELASLLESLSLQQRIRADHDKRAGTHRARCRVRHPNERRKELPIRHYGLLKFLRRASIASGGHGHGSSYAAALRTPGVSHAFVRSGLGRGRRAADHMRGVPRTDLYPPRGVRRAASGTRGLLGGVQCARARAGTSGLARR